MKKLISFFTVLAALAAVHAGTVDFTSSPGPVKPVHSVGQPPLDGDTFGEWTMMSYLKEANIPYSRLHDAGGWLGGGGLFVDVPNLFPDFTADETDPANYRFAYTDNLLAALMKNGVEPFFRLGVTIENWMNYTTYEHSGDFTAIAIDPPADYAKWARICEHIIRHYNEGWANGFHYGITYWEIWNEADCSNKHPAGDRNMWTGTWTEFVNFYGVAATYLKQQFPDLKIGGYAATNLDAITDPDGDPTVGSGGNVKFLEAAVQFLTAARDNNWPLDFFSYHCYDAVSAALSRVYGVDKLLNHFGFTRDKTERILNEWLPQANVSKLGTAGQATEVAAEIIGFQNGALDLACIYDARSHGGLYGPLFNADTLQPYPAYYSLKAFGELYALGTAAKCEGFPANFYVAAATDGAGGNRAILVANLSGKNFSTADIDWGEGAQLVKAVNATANYAEQDTMPATLANNSVWLFRLYDENGATPGISATVTGVSGRAGEGPFSCSLSVINPTTGWEATWYDETGAEYGVTAPEYNEEGIYTNIVKVTADGYPDFYGTGVVTVTYYEPLADLSLSITGSSAEVTVLENVVTSPVKLVLHAGGSSYDIAAFVPPAGGTYAVNLAELGVQPGATVSAALVATADQVEYLESTGSQCVKLPFEYEVGTRVTMDAQLTATLSTAQIMWGYGAANGGWLGAAGNASTYFFANPITSAYITAVGVRHVSWIQYDTVSTQSGSFDGGTVYNCTGTTPSVQSHQKLTVFASIKKDGSTDFWAKMRLWSLSVTHPDGSVDAFVPIKVNGDGALYDLTTGVIYSNGGTTAFTCGDVQVAAGATVNESEGVIYGAPTAVMATVENYSGIVDGQEHAATVTVTYPESDYEIRWAEVSENPDYSITEPPAYSEAGSYTNLVKVTAPDLDPFYGECVVTLEEPAAPVTVTSADGAITVIIAADTVTESAPVYLAWDDADKGDTFAAWSNKVKLGEVGAEVGVFAIEGADYEIPDGAAIRAFVVAYSDIEFLEYIQSSGTQYIDTGIVGAWDDVYEIKFAVVSQSADSAYLAAGVDNSKDSAHGRYHLAVRNTAGQLRQCIGGLGSAGQDPLVSPAYATTVGTFYTVVSDFTKGNRKLEIYDADKSSLIDSDIETTVVQEELYNPNNCTIYIFACNIDAEAKQMTRANWKVSSFKLTRGGAVVKNLVAAKKGTAVGMVDLANGNEFYPNKGSNSFTAGGVTGKALGEVVATSAAATYSEGGEEPPTPPSVPQWIALYTEQASSDTSTNGEEMGNYTAYYCTVEAAQAIFGSSAVDAVTQYLKNDYETGSGRVASEGILLDADEYGAGQYGFIKYDLSIPFVPYLGFVFYDNGEVDEFRVFGADNLEEDDTGLTFDDTEPGTVGGWTKPTTSGIPVGEGLSATFADGTCTISGTGAMWEASKLAALQDLAITNLVIGDGITSISADAFKSMWGIRNVTIASTVTNIGAQSFHKCYNLTNVVIHTGATAPKVGEYAFFRCNSLVRITVTGGSSVDWGENAFTLQAGIRMSSAGLPEIYPIPEIIDENGYGPVLYGTNDLGGNNWTKINSDADRANYHFFKIKIEKK